MKKKIILPLAGIVLVLFAGCENVDKETVPPSTAVEVTEGGQDEQSSENVSEKDLDAGNPSETAQGSSSQKDSLEENTQGSSLGDSSEGNPQESGEAEFRFADLSGWVFHFSSGVGAWYTELRIREDGSFEGHYQDADMGVSGDGYPRGTLYYCDFSGSFKGLEKVDAHTYKMRLASIAFENEPETEAIIDETLYIYSPAYGLDGGEEFYLYLPDSKMADLPEEYKTWVRFNRNDPEVEELGFYGLYNVNTENGFSSAADEQQSLSERISLEISNAEEREKDLNARGQEAASQHEMNAVAAEKYQLWDDTLNAVWKLLEANLNQADMEALRQEEIEWITWKENEIRAAGLENEGGSLQPLLEAGKGAELTKARVYTLLENAGAYDG